MPENDSETVPETSELTAFERGISQSTCANIEPPVESTCASQPQTTDVLNMTEAFQQKKKSEFIIITSVLKVHWYFHRFLIWLLVWRYISCTAYSNYKQSILYSIHYIHISLRTFCDCNYSGSHSYHNHCLWSVKQ